MAEYIDREAAIKTMENADCALIADYAESCKADYLREIIESVPAADVVPATQWIPVAERLPEKWLDDAGMVNYMIYSPDFGVDIGCYHAEAKKWLCMALPCTVTHWMPMPEPPEEGNDGDK